MGRKAETHHENLERLIAAGLSKARGYQRTFTGGAVGPKGPTRLLDRAQALVVGLGTLDYESHDTDLLLLRVECR